LCDYERFDGIRRNTDDLFECFVGDDDDERISEFPDCEHQNVDENQNADDSHQLIVFDHLHQRTQLRLILRLHDASSCKRGITLRLKNTGLCYIFK